VEAQLTPLLDGPLGLVAAGLLGALWGSFYNVCIARIPRGESVVRPPSHCGACGKPVRALDNIPIVSYFLLRGRCRDCGAQFSIRYALIEMLGALTSAVLFWKLVMLAPGDPPGVRLARFAVGFAFTGVLLVLSFIDLDTKRLPDVITLPSIPLFFVLGFATGDIPWLDRLIGAAAGYLAVRIIADGYYYLTGREGLGLGDGKLLAVVGALLGWRALPGVIFAASFVGVLVSIPILLIQRRREEKAAAARAGASAVSEEASAVSAQAAAGGSTVSGASSAPAGAGAGDDAGAAGDGEADAVVPLRRTEVPFGPFLSLSAYVYLVAGREIQAALMSLLYGDMPE
jgi:leader peptidase (prepilin peptidase) / N-methyltransferase